MLLLVFNSLVTFVRINRLGFSAVQSKKGLCASATNWTIQWRIRFSSLSDE